MLTIGILIGADSGSSGTYSLSGSGLLSAASETIGYYGTGSFTQSGGTNSLSGILTLGLGTGNIGAALSLEWQRPALGAKRVCRLLHQRQFRTIGRDEFSWQPRPRSKHRLHGELQSRRWLAEPLRIDARERQRRVQLQRWNLAGRVDLFDQCAHQSEHGRKQWRTGHGEFFADVDRPDQRFGGLDQGGNRNPGAGR